MFMEENKELEKEEVKEEKKMEKPKKNKINKELEALKEENKNLQDKVLRTTAEMQNMRRRQEEEISRIRKYEGDDILKKILPIIDNFERAIKLDDNDLTDELSKFLSGFKMIYTNLISVLEEKEVKEIVCKDKEFDSSLMEAVLTEHVDGIEKNQVLEVLQKGYTYKDKLLRPAMVKVSE
jgi:molecular chaperone GrpE